MRTRYEIEKLIEKLLEPYDGYTNSTDKLVLINIELLLDIRELLIKEEKHTN